MPLTAQEIIPSGIAKDVTLNDIAYLLSVIAEKLPRIDSNDRIVINGSEIASSVTVASGTITTAADVTRLNNIGAMAGFNHANYVVPHIANAGATLIYDQIKFS